jgi:hypothetical protein
MERIEGKLELVVTSPDQLFVEETLKGTGPGGLDLFRLVYVAETTGQAGYDEALRFMRGTKNRNRLELWSQAKTEKAHGYRPYAVRENGRVVEL